MELLEKARELPVAERQPFLQKACGDDRDFLAEINSLLEADAGDSHFMKEPLLEASYTWCREELGDDHPRTAIALNNLAFIYQELELHDQALEMFRRFLESRRRVHGNQSQSVIIGLHNLGMQLTIMDHAEDAPPLFEEEIQTSRDVLDDTHWLKPWIHSTYGRTLVKLERYQEAEKELLTSLEGVRAILGDDHWRTRKLCVYIAGLYDATGDKDHAAEYLALSEQSSTADPPS